MKWWEKTVEYYFVSKFIDIDVVIAPLDGKEERLGDAIFSKKNHWILIEFKRKKDSLKSEEKKFSDFQKAKNELSGEDGHHFLIYGVFDEVFSLECKTYFSREEYESIEEALRSGTDIDSFSRYIEKFTTMKKPPDNGGGGGGLSFEEYSIVACVSNDGDIVATMSLEDYKKSVKMEHEPEPQPRMKYRSM